MQDPQEGAGAVPDTCAAWSETLSEPMAGTAAVAASWLCLEQPGPWGRDAPLESHLDPGIGARLAERAATSGVRVQLIRRPGRHPDTGANVPRTVYLAHTRPGASWLRRAELTDPARLLDLDFGAFARGEHGGWGVPTTEPVLLVCTNGRRDQCCALRGISLLREVGQRHEGRLWETTHTGGHRFAPTAVTLPSGYNYGRLTPHGVDAVLSAAAAGKMTTAHCRGRSAFSQPAQVAELALRENLGEHAGEALNVVSEADGEVVLRHRDGRRWNVRVRGIASPPPRPNSCGKAAVAASTWAVERIRRVPDPG
ncbi:sucrase ferredoxin [Actinopolyspora erythraea]|uniref:Sucrase ferredoxin n=1 Tax=Actinopolyspora erythraea TaxID=414996 RepID=A0A223RPV0_9ACTN|nr:sucrase ferredoxin [Actinopolyspora erythraea]ASU77903.1 sucrase ferredoxin [Actinopolyspora erythraea]